VPERCICRWQGQGHLARKFKKVDYDAALRQTVTVGDCLSPNHLGRFIVSVIALLDLSGIYVRYAALSASLTS